MEILLTFDSTNDAIKAEHVLLSGALDVKVMSLPSSIRAGCGLCLRVTPRDLPAAQALLAAVGVAPGGLYTRTMENGASRYAPLDATVLPPQL